jgi:hypothetical protein
VLITLVVIGVIAAITVPTLMANYRKQEASAKLKKFYSTMQQVVTKAKADGNDWEEWADSASGTADSTGEIPISFLKKYVLPYIIYQKIVYDTYIYLNDGSYFWIYKGACLDFVYDINGVKKPNELGRDKFKFLYCPVSVPYGYTTPAKFSPFSSTSIKTREQAKEKCKNDTYYCAGLLFFDGWEFKSDYPYKI